jgi:hypothetical protein
MLFIDYSSVFNTIVPSKLIIKLGALGLNHGLDLHPIAMEKMYQGKERGVKSPQGELSLQFLANFAVPLPLQGARYRISILILS